MASFLFGFFRAVVNPSPQPSPSHCSEYTRSLSTRNRFTSLPSLKLKHQSLSRNIHTHPLFRSMKPKNSMSSLQRLKVWTVISLGYIDSSARCQPALWKCLATFLRCLVAADVLFPHPRSHNFSQVGATSVHVDFRILAVFDMEILLKDTWIAPSDPFSWGSDQLLKGQHTHCLSIYLFYMAYFALGTPQGS